MIAFYTSGHGFGHASRDIEVINAIRRQRPDVPLIVRSAVPAWLFAVSSRDRLEVESLDTDPGVAQHDSTSIDEEETARRARHFYRDFDAHMTAEMAWLIAHRITLVVADIPPLAIAAAERAGIRSVALANFTWDWIYEGFPHFTSRAPGVIGVIAAAYGKVTHALRLPLHGGFAPMLPVVRDIALVARRSSVGRSAARRALNLPVDRPIVLASFGGHRVDLPYATAAAGGHFTLLVTGEHAASASNEMNESAQPIRISPQDLAARQLHYEDLVAAADVVVSKPGYGIVSECIANETALLYTSRGRLAEYDVMVAEMPRLLRCRFVAPEDLLAGRWADALDALLRQPPPSVKPPINGADVAAEFILGTAGY
jgi:L-arabinokinase